MCGDELEVAEYLKVNERVLPLCVGMIGLL